MDVRNLESNSGRSPQPNALFTKPPHVPPLTFVPMYSV